MTRIAKLEVQGLRAFGAKPQTLAFPSDIAVVWGANSQGKTSLAEVCEFLLTGQIVRRELMASSQDEFADALRNAHLPAGTVSYVEAQFVTKDGTTHTVKRVLTTDYGKKQDCVSALQIDGKPAIEADLASIGIVLSQPPLRAPVLAQHTLGYLFSARPQERATYFKALLEVADLDAFRNEVVLLQDGLIAPQDAYIAQLEAAAAVPEATSLKPLLERVPTPANVDAALSAVTAAILTASGVTPPPTSEARFDRLATLLAQKRDTGFPLKAFERKPLTALSAPTGEQYASLSAYIKERSKLDEQTRQLTSLFREVLSVPAIAEASAALDCPVCDTPQSLTPERIAYIRMRLADTEAFQQAERNAQTALARMAAATQATKSTLTSALPLFLTNPSKSRRTRGFRIDGIASLLGHAHEPTMRDWLAKVRKLARAYRVAMKALRAVDEELGLYADLKSLNDPAGLEQNFERLTAACEEFGQTLASYAASADAVLPPLTVAVDAQARTAGWEELLKLCHNQGKLRAALIDRAAVADLQKELAQAVKQIDKGNEAVLDDKFGALSKDVETWWNLLRPDELSFFANVGPRAGARRTIDFKAGLAAQPDRSDTKLRDAIAVFSQSQLHCLGLAVFIARAVHEGSGFIVLDDPILSSDEDYRAHFSTGVLERLLDLGVQVVVLTQDQKTFKDLGHRYAHRSISMFQIVLQNPRDGSIVTDTADDLASLLSRAEIISRGGHPDLRKQAGGMIRDAGERFCKEVLVKNCVAKGQLTASVVDYDGKDLGHLCPLVEPLLDKDPAHPGKLRTISGAVNPAQHDDTVPSAGTLKVSIGDLRALKKSYL